MSLRGALFPCHCEECSDEAISKGKILNSKIKILNNIKALNTNALNVYNFDISIYLEIGFWDLEFSQ